MESLLRAGSPPGAGKNVCRKRGPSGSEPRGHADVELVREEIWRRPWRARERNPHGRQLLDRSGSTAAVVYLPRRERAAMGAVHCDRSAWISAASPRSPEFGGGAD